MSENLSPHRPARSKSQLIAQDHHAVLPPEYQAGGDSKREDLCQPDSERANEYDARRIKIRVNRAGGSSSGRPVATQDSREKKVHLHPNTDGENYIREFDDPANIFQPHSEEEHEFCNQVFGEFLCKIW